MSTVTHRITLVKLAKRSLQEKVVNDNGTNILASRIVGKAMQVKGWAFEPDCTREGTHAGRNWRQRYSTDKGYEYRYEMYFVITFTGDKTPEETEFQSLVRTLATRVTNPANGRWELAEVDGEPFRKPEASENGEEHANALGYAPVEIPDDWDDHFTHLYGLDSQITMARCAIEAGEQSDWANRFHCVFVGPPGCGKSDVASSIKAALGDDAVMELDATATTGAGAIKELSEREILPRVLVVEEIEKADEKAMSFLLALMDQRGEIRKTTARATIVRDTKLFCIATVNDTELFGKLQAGALASRFSNVIGFERPTRKLLGKILNREIKKVNGDLAWIEPTLDYCEQQGISDPRRVTSICLCGRERLLDGSYQKLLSDTQPNKTEGAAS